MAREPSFVLRGVRKSFGGFTALADVNLRVEAGEQVALIGPSGAGKSTLIGLLNGTLQPSAGQVRVLGQDLAQLAPRQRRRLQSQLGSIYQQFQLVANLRVIHNVNAGHLGRWSTLRALVSLLWPLEVETATAALLRVGIADKLYQRTGLLSGGEQQRVALARVLVQDPQAILADEPIASLDPERGRELMDLLRELGAQSGKTLVASLHSVEYARSHFDRIVALRGGRVFFDGPAAALTPALVEDIYRIERPEPSRPEAVRGAGARESGRVSAAGAGPGSLPPEVERPVSLHRALEKGDRRERAPTLPGRPRILALALQAAVVGAVLLASLAVAGVLGRGPLINRSGWPLVWQFLRAAVHPELTRATVTLAIESTFITLAFAVCGTSLALALGLVGGVLCAELLGRPRDAEGGGRRRLRCLAWVTARALLAVPRAIHEMIWGLFLVNVMGLDPLVAVLAIALPFGAITSKVFGEIFDETPRAAYEALRAAGASELTALVYGILPQALPDLLSYAFYRFECAIRAAALLGLIGAGGLGYQILLSLQSLQYAQIWTFLYALLLLGGLADGWSSLLRRRLQRTGGSDPAARLSLLGAALLIPLSFWFIGGDAGRLFSGKTLRLLGGVLRESWPPRLDAVLIGRLGHLALDTLAMSILAIVLAGIGGLIASFPAAASLAMPGSLLDAQGSGRGKRLGGLIVLAAARGILLFGRALSEAIWALLVLFILFPGVLPGAVALGLYNLGVLGRLMAAVHDDLDPQPLRALAAQGASRGQVFFYGVLPQTLPRCLAYVFYRWEVCIRASVVVGLVGAGGLGRILNDQLSSFDYRGVVTTLAVLSVLTLLVDLASAAARRRLR